MTALVTPAPTQTVYRCAWCRCEGSVDEIRRVPGTHISLCEQCWLRYCGIGKGREVCKEDKG